MSELKSKVVVIDSHTYTTVGGVDQVALIIRPAKTIPPKPVPYGVEAQQIFDALSGFLCIHTLEELACCITHTPSPHLIEMREGVYLGSIRIKS